MPWPTARNALVRTTAALPTPPRYEYIAVPLAAASVSSLDRREKLLAERKFPSPLEPDFSKLGLDRLGSMNSDFVCSRLFLLVERENREHESRMGRGGGLASRNR